MSNPAVGTIFLAKMTERLNRSSINELPRFAGYDQQVMRDLPLIYLYNPINRFGVSKTTGNVQIFADGLIRAQYAGFKK